MNYIFLAVSVLMDMTTGLLTNFISKTKFKTNTDIQAFNLLSSATTLIVLFVAYSLFGMLCIPSLYTVGLGIIYGLATGLCAIFYMKALGCGPLSYTKVIMSCAMIIPSLSGMVFFNETISLIHYIGIALMLICFVLAVEKNKDKEKANLKWFFYCILVFVLNGSFGVFQKFHQTSEYKNEIGMFLLVAFSSSVLLSLILVSIYRKKEKVEITVFKNGKIWLCSLVILVCGCAVAFCNHFNMYLSGVLPAIIFFPIVNGGTMIVTTTAGLVIFKERLTSKQIVGLASGILAILLLCFSDPIKQIFFML